ncbi:hypothetical protein LAX75_08565 [Listeria cossartiae]|uniref:nuclease domain-containing protein n=1 Tax=Listeria cossartiae TaxID=2838249 RepID=UPI001E60A78E|nr:nuclease domain-containing protein [Listeria cossartiae]MCD2224512.1 hypothetical protein [Listeria cossartiae]MCD2239426.1 hypothetical protein [Listeria cossartiae]
MDLPFDLSINTSYNQYNMEFYTTEELLEKEIDKLPKIKEFETLQFLLTSEESVKLFIPELDDYDLRNRKVDKYGNLYFTQNKEKVTIFSYKDDMQVPLIPGFYYIYIEKDECRYYTGFQIIPKDLEISEWYDLKNDIEKRVVGLSVDFIKRKKFDKKISNVNEKNQASLWEKIEYFLEDIPQAMIALENLKKDAKFKIKKEYNWQPIGSKTLIDNETIKKIQQRPDKRGFLYSPRRKLVYDIIDNQWIKYIMLHFSKFCRVADTYLNNILISLQAQNEEESKYKNARQLSEQIYLKKKSKSQLTNVEEEKKKIKSFYAYIQDYLKEGFLKDVKGNRPHHVPKSLVLVPKYNVLYKMYLRNIRNSSEIRFESEYQHYWKKTDVLYEIWSYIEVLEALIDNGYTPEKGWIFNQTAMIQPLPFLYDGTVVCLKKENVCLRVIYNGVLPGADSLNTIDSPLKITSKRNKPDIRIDILINDVEYTGSILLDAKYKKLLNIISSSYSGRQIEQLREYRNSCISTIIDIPEVVLHNTKAVQSVIAIYPNNNTNSAVKKSFDEQGICFIQLRPSFGQEEFAKSLLEKIEERLEFYNTFEH